MMPDNREQLYTALRNADAAGDTKAAQRLASYIQSLPTAGAAQVDPQLAGVPGADPTMLDGNRGAAPAADPSLVDRALGVGEALLSGATGIAGAAAGAVAGAVKTVASGKYGTQEGLREGEELAGRVGEALTYQPRSQFGQEALQVGAQALSDSGIAGLALPELNAAANAVGNASRAVRGAAAASAATQSAADAAAIATKGPGLRDLVRAPTGAAEAPVVSQIRKVSPTIADRVQRTLSRNPSTTPTPGTKGSVGAAGTDMATQRQMVADKVGIDLTQGQATRDQQQLRFEQETAKGENGGRLRDRYSDQNEQVLKHFDNLVDQTGKETPDLAGTGRSVDGGLRAGLDYDKGRVRVAYKVADKSAEGAAPVTLDAAIDFLNESAPDAAVSPLLDVARKRAIRLGAAIEDADGNLVAQPTTVKNAELLRRAIGNATDFEPTNIRNSAIIKGAIDSATEPAIGPLYRNARRLRENLAKKYEDRGVVASLLNNKRGMADRKVAIADVFEHSILNASREDAGAVRRALTHGKEAPAEIRELGQQAWHDLQGETMNWIKEQAFSNTATDQRGNVILSVPKLDKAIKRLDADGRLQLMFGKQGAQHLRDLNDLAKVIYTTPPGAVNTSNTASVLLAAFAEAGVTGSMTGLPVPVLSTLRVLSKQVKNRQLQKRIEHALTRGRATGPTTQPSVRPSGATLH
jgi:hypothetical protein